MEAARVSGESSAGGSGGSRSTGGTGGGSGASGSGRRRPSITGRAAVLALVIAVLLVSYAYPLRTWWEQHSERQELEAEAQQLAQDRERLERELELWDDPAFVAAQARERLGFVMPGEQGYVVVPADDDADDAGIDGLPPAGRGEWHERLWSSLEAADTVPVEAVRNDGSTSGRTTRGSDGTAPAEDGATSDDAESDDDGDEDGR